MNMTPDIWKFVTTAIKSNSESPPWLKEQVDLSWDMLAKLPVVDETENGQRARPTLEKKIVASDYLDFLREQIHLNARGPEWLSLLKKRLIALEPFVGKPLIIATFYCKPHSVILRICPKTKHLVHLESS